MDALGNKIRAVPPRVLKNRNKRDYGNMPIDGRKQPHSADYTAFRYPPLQMNCLSAIPKKRAKQRNSDKIHG